MSYDLSGITQPTLIMWGRQDTLALIENGEKFSRIIPHASTVFYDNVGHVPMEEIPGESAADLRGFLQNLPQPIPANGTIKGSTDES